MATYKSVSPCHRSKLALLGAGTILEAQSSMLEMLGGKRCTPDNTRRQRATASSNNSRRRCSPESSVFCSGSGRWTSGEGSYGTQPKCGTHETDDSSVCGSRAVSASTERVECTFGSEDDEWSEMSRPGNGEDSVHIVPQLYIHFYSIWCYWERSRTHEQKASRLHRYDWYESEVTVSLSSSCQRGSCPGHVVSTSPLSSPPGSLKRCSSVLVALQKML